jgi:hypothetical protein
MIASGLVLCRVSDLAGWRSEIGIFQNIFRWGIAMRLTCLWRSVLMIAAVAAIWAVATPAEAQLAPGCACPAGFAPLTSTTCVQIGKRIVPATVPAICPGRNIGHIAAEQIDQSFWGINQMLQAKRDQLQATPVKPASSPISGYSSSFTGDGDNFSYADQSQKYNQKNNPLATPLYDAAPSPPNPIWGVWVQGLGDWEHDKPLAATDSGNRPTTYTTQAGIDRTQQGVLSGDDALVIGIVSSWTSTHTSYDGSPITADLTGPGVGVYTEYVRGGWSADLTAKVDFLQMSQNLAGAAPNISVGIINEGLSGNVQYKVKGLLGSDNNFVEPTVGFTLSHVSFSNGVALDLEDAYRVKLQAGARFGTTWDAGHDVSVDASLKALVYGDAIAQGTSVAGASDPPTQFNTPFSPSDAGLIRGELDPELAFNLPNDYSVTVSGQFRYGRAIMGGSAGLNLRKQW